VVAWEADVSEAAQIEATVFAAARKFGRLDVLVNNASTSIPKSFNDLSLEEWHKVLDVNLTACFIGSRAADREMRRQGGSSIVNVCSVHRTISEPNSGAYAASKGGIAQLTRNLAIEMAIDDIAVNSISPSFIRTRMSILNGVDGTTTPQFLNYFATSGRIPLRRASLPEEVTAGCAVRKRRHSAPSFEKVVCQSADNDDILVEVGSSDHGQQPQALPVGSRPLAHGGHAQD
jgi:NAD(P)-dependent dehydrogenase (short-subunit alcohol dehydrogenase family)